LEALKGATMSKKRGPELGNRNAIKHGWYASSFSIAEKSPLTIQGEGYFNDEIAQLRAHIARTAHSIRNKNHMPIKDYLAALCTLTLEIVRLESLTFLLINPLAEISGFQQAIEKGIELACQDLGVHNYFNPPAPISAVHENDREPGVVR